ncbi:MAG: ABC transporter ATP-binding protein [Candidatus Riflebacteria bacterium]|nr:ABC transporter ATP-binding protein [Candidatus Riflebacteria bacterium]
MLEVKDLCTYFFGEEGVGKAVDEVNFRVRRREVLGIVGESGCGKSVTSLSIMRLIPNPPGRTVRGEIVFEGRDLLKLPEDVMRTVRGNKISMIFQEPMTSLNPVFTIGNQLTEAIRLHMRMSAHEARDRAIKLMELVGIPFAAERLGDYPHQFSGGMRERIMIAMALSCDPQLIIADEPTTALDVTIQAQILELMKSLQRRLHTSIILITHDLAVIAEMAHRVIVMYAGRVVEEADVREMFKSPKHPYTIGLLCSIPRVDQPGGRLCVIQGTVPSPFRFPKGCRFSNRCPLKFERCDSEEPPLVPIRNQPGHATRCWLYETNQDPSVEQEVRRKMLESGERA